MQQFNTHPRGITLMEVLISMGILAVGLASVVALVPAGGSQARLAMIDNTSINVGSAAMADLVNRGGLNPANWLINVNGTDVQPTAPYSVVIDPLGVDNFPEGPNGPSDPRGLAKVTFKNIVNRSNDAERVFRWKDDLLYVLPDPDEGGPPTPLYDTNSSTIMHEGNFSWLATIQDDPNDNDPQRYTVSVVTFYRRLRSEDLPIKSVLDLPLNLGTTDSGGNPLTAPLNVIKVNDVPPDEADFRLAFPRNSIMLFSNGFNHAWRRIAMATPVLDDGLPVEGELLLSEDLPFVPDEMYVYPGAIALTEFTIAIEEMSPWSS